MAVRMLKYTRFEGIRVVGEIYGDLPKDVENRWIKNGIAELVEIEVAKVDCEDGNCILPELQDLPETNAEVVSPEVEVVEDGEEESDDEVRLKDLSAKQLFRRCKEKGIDVEPKMDREHYIDLLELSEK